MQATFKYDISWNGFPTLWGEDRDDRRVFHQRTELHAESVRKAWRRSVVGKSVRQRIQMIHWAVHDNNTMRDD